MKPIESGTEHSYKNNLEIPNRSILQILTNKKVSE